MEKDNKYDLAIIGAGPAGLMAALRASELGKKVVVIEKNVRPGIKLMITGGGRCNITNNIPDYHLLAENYGTSGRFLLSTFSRFGVSETIDFFETHGLMTKTEADNKVFPVTDSAKDVLNVLLKDIKNKGGVLITNMAVKGLIFNNGEIEKLLLVNGEEIRAENYLIATGGLSYPMTGSSGDGFAWLKKMGHTIKTPRPALSAVLLEEYFVKELQGLSLEKVNLELHLKDKLIAEESGPIIFTSQGVSGPAVLNISRHINLSSGKHRILLDYFPEKNVDEIDQDLLAILSKSNKFLKNALEQIMPLRLAEIIIFISGIHKERKANSLNRAERKNLAANIKNLIFEVKSIEGFDKAMVTVGGVDLKEVDPKTMKSKLISNLYLAGEVLDIAGPTGGYNLQVAWSTGWVAGDSVGRI